MTHVSCLKTLWKRFQGISSIILVEGMKYFSYDVIGRTGYGKTMVDLLALISPGSTSSARPFQFLLFWPGTCFNGLTFRSIQDRMLASASASWPKKCLKRRLAFISCLICGCLEYIFDSLKSIRIKIVSVFSTPMRLCSDSYKELQEKQFLLYVFPFENGLHCILKANCITFRGETNYCLFALPSLHFQVWVEQINWRDGATIDSLRSAEIPKNVWK